MAADVANPSREAALSMLHLDQVNDPHHAF
jgi:hypothetical protein